MRIRALLAALTIAGASFAMFAPVANATPTVCVTVHAQIQDQAPVDVDQCLPPQ